MGKLTTHVLDTMNGTPAAGMAVELYRVNRHAATLLQSFNLNDDGRTPGPLLEGAALLPGCYRLLFDMATYFRARGAALPEPPFLDRVSIDFGVADTSAHYHVPLLCSPWAYSTYRGS
jgi:5-hydroxyisourate hydrolase